MKAMFQRKQIDNSHFDDQGTAFIWMWSVFCMFHLTRRIFEIDFDNPGLLYILATLFSLLAILKPRLMYPFVISVVLGLLATLGTMPIGSNHTLMRIVLMTGMVFSFLYVFVQQRHILHIRAGDFYASFAPFGKAMLAIMYFYGVFHKLNTDFLDPSTSCAVKLWELYPLPFGLADALWTHYIAIYAALIIETAIIVMLFIPHLKYAGLLLGLAFHFILGINGYRFFVAFSSMTFSLHFLFLSADFVSRFQQGKTGVFILKNRWNYPVLVFAMLALYGATLALDLMSFYYATLSMFITVSVGIMSAVAIYTRNAVVRLDNTWRGLFTPNSILYLLSALYFISCAMPFIGLKTQQNLNMFSNLYTEQGQTNHIVFTKPPYLFDYQNDVVRILRSNVPFFRELRDEGLLIPYFEFRRMLSQASEEHMKHLMLEYERNGKIEMITLDKVTDPGVLEPLSPWLEDWFHFRFVATKRPMVCNGSRLPESRDEIYKGRDDDMQQNLKQNKKSDLFR